MNKWSKIGISATMGISVIATTHAINKFIFRMSGFLYSKVISVSIKYNRDNYFRGKELY